MFWKNISLLNFFDILDKNSNEESADLDGNDTISEIKDDDEDVSKEQRKIFLFT